MDTSLICYKITQLYHTIHSACVCRTARVQIPLFEFPLVHHTLSFCILILSLSFFPFKYRDILSQILIIFFLLFFHVTYTSTDIPPPHPFQMSSAQS